MNIQRFLSVSLLSVVLAVATTLAVAQDQARDLMAGSANVHAGGGNILAFASGRGMPERARRKRRAARANTTPMSAVAPREHREETATRAH